MNIYLCILLLHIIIHIQVVTETEVVGWVMGGDVFAEDYTLSMAEKNYLLRKGFAYTSVEVVSDRMSHIMMRVGRCDLALIVRALTVNRNNDSRNGFLQGIREVFDHFPTYHMQILLGCCKGKFGREDLFKLTTGEIYSLHTSSP